MLAEAVGHHEADRLGEAERLYREILQVDGRNAEALHLLGLVAQQAGFLEAAAALMRTAIAHRGPGAADRREAVYRSNLGNVLQMQGSLDEGVGEYERALVLCPGHVPALTNLGVALQSLGRLEEAEVRLRQAAELRPDAAQVLDNLGNVLQALGRHEEALEHHRQALESRPGNAETYGNLGLALQELGQWDAALESYERALALRPENARIELARAQLQLLRGEFSEGLRNYESRKRVHGQRQLAGQEWPGEALGTHQTEGRILLYAEQGLGDTVQFLRYVPLVTAMGATVILEVQKPIVRLAEQLGCLVVAAGEPLPEFQWHCSLMSLPLIFHGQSAFPRQTPYLAAPQAAIRKMDSLPWPGNGDAGSLQVGLVWAGNPAHVRDRFRSIPFPLLDSLLDVEGVNFYGLQVGQGSGQLSAQEEPRITGLSGMIEDMSDTAALIEKLDLVITVDTAVAHLAGALGRPVWTLLPFAPDWRWGLDREDSPWYPTMRLFRQRRAQDWSEVLERVIVALREEARCSR
jgi:tetratricopeptide (TPR) repeat protein